MKVQRNLFQKRNKKKKAEEKKTNEREINNLLDKEYKTSVIRMLTNPGKRIDEHNENFNKELEKYKKETDRSSHYVSEG